MQRRVVAPRSGEADGPEVARCDSMASKLSAAEVQLATWAHAGFGAKRPAAKGEKIEYVSCFGDVCTKESFTPPPYGGRTFAPTAPLVLALLTQKAAMFSITAISLLVVLITMPAGEGLLALADNQYASGAPPPGRPRIPTT